MPHVIPHRRASGAFTLIELLTVIAIIGILAAIIIPTVSKVRTSARAAQCAALLREWGRVIQLYANENKGFYTVEHWASAKAGEGPYRDYFTRSNAMSLRIRTCPLHPDNGIADPPLTYGLVRGHKLQMGQTASSTTKILYPKDKIPLNKAPTPSQYLLMVDTVANSNAELSIQPSVLPLQNMVLPMFNPSLNSNPTGTNVGDTIEGAKRHGSNTINAVFGDGSVRKINGNATGSDSILAQREIWFRIE